MAEGTRKQVTVTIREAGCGRHPAIRMNSLNPQNSSLADGLRAQFRDEETKGRVVQ